MRHRGAPVFPMDDVVSVQPQSLGAPGVGAALVTAGEVAAHGAVGGALGGVDADELAEPVGHDLHLRRRRRGNRATSRPTGPISSWAGPRVPSGSRSMCNTTVLRSPRCPVRRRVGSRASAASEAMRTSPSAHDTERAPATSTGLLSSSGSGSGRSLRSRNSASRALVSPRRTTAPSSAGRQNWPRSQPSPPSRRRSIRSGSGCGLRRRQVARGGERSSRSSWETSRLRGDRRDLGVRNDGDAAGNADHCVFLQPPGGERSEHSGRSRTRRAMVTRPSARGRDRLAFQHNQCSGD